MRLKPGPEQQERRTTVAEVEADWLAEHGWFQLLFESKERRKMLRKPMGGCNAEWEELKALMQPGDELCEVCADMQSWNRHMGWHYLELRRNGDVISQVLLRMN